MAAKNILPREILEQTTEFHLSGVMKASQLVYVSVVTCLGILFSLTPHTNVEVSVKSAGLLKASSEPGILKAPAAGIIKGVFIEENMLVKKEQVLFEVHSPVLEEKLKFYSNEVQETKSFIRDLEALVPRISSVIASQLSTELYRQSLFDFQHKLIDRQTRFLKAKVDYDRNKKLYEQKVIAAVDFENFQFELDKSRSEIELLKQGQLSQWQQELRKFEEELAYLDTQLAQTQKEIESLYIKASVGGTVQNLTGVYPGSTVFAGQELAQISPDTDLLAEVYVSPNDIGLLRPGMDVRMQVGAFNYNQWGLLNGKVKEISNDIQIMDNRPMFEVRCSLEKEYLTLKNGYKGNLKKGMTLQARFVVTKRSLWQLLYDKADDWLNPNIIAEPILTK